MRLLLVIALSALTGCSTLKRWVGMDGDAEPLPPPAEVPKQGTLNTIGEKVDKADARVASAVTVMVENKDKPAVVEAEGRETFEARFDEVKARYEGQDVPRPPHWGGFRVTPERIEFWEDREYRLHHRRLFLPAGTGWAESLLYP